MLCYFICREPLGFIQLSLCLRHSHVCQGRGCRILHTDDGFSHPHLSNNYHTYVARTVSKVAGVDAGLGLTDLPARCNPRIGVTQENEKVRNGANNFHMLCKSWSDIFWFN